MDDLISRTFISSPSEMLEKILVLNIFSNFKKMYLLKFARISNVLEHLWMVTIRSCFLIIMALLIPIRCSFEKIRSQKSISYNKEKDQINKTHIFLVQEKFYKKIASKPSKTCGKENSRKSPASNAWAAIFKNNDFS